MRKPSSFTGASRARSCEGKQAFQNAGHAKRIMMRVLAAGKVYGEPRLYHWRFCGLWHWSGGSGQAARYARVVNAIDRALTLDRARAERAAPRTPASVNAAQTQGEM